MVWDLAFQIRVELASNLSCDFVTFLVFSHRIIFSYSKEAVSTFFNEYFRGTGKVKNVNIDFNNDWLMLIFPLHVKDSISVISDTSGHFWSS